jgi:hypothetical protein
MKRLHREEQKASPGITKFPNTGMWNNMQRFQKISLIPKGSLSNFFLHKKKKKEKMGV